MVKTVALILARPNSSRLPDKHNRKIGNLTVMDWIIERLRGVVDEVVICTTQKDEHYYERYIDGQVKVIAPIADDEDVIGRIKSASNIFTGNYYLIISGDCPLISTPIMKQLIKQLMCNKGYDASMIDYGTSHVGADAISWEGIQKFEHGENLSLDLVPNLNVFRQMMIPGIYATFRGTVDNQADLAFLRECQRILQDKFTFEGVSDLIGAMPSINNLNKHVSQKEINFTTDKSNVALLTEGDSKIGIGHVARVIALGQYYNECCHKHIHFFIPRNKMVTEMLESCGYEHKLDYSYGSPSILVEDFEKWEFIRDTYNYTNIDYDKEYRKNPSFAVNYRINYVPDIIESDVVVSFGMGKFKEYGVKIFEELSDCKRHLLMNVNNMSAYLAGAERIITVWSQTARESIFLGKVPEVYSTNLKDDKLCKHLDKQGVLKWQGNIFEKTGV